MHQLRAAILAHIAVDPDDFAGREKLYMQHDRMRECLHRIDTATFGHRLAAIAHCIIPLPFL